MDTVRIKGTFAAQRFVVENIIFDRYASEIYWSLTRKFYQDKGLYWATLLTWWLKDAGDPTNVMIFETETGDVVILHPGTYKKAEPALIKYARKKPKIVKIPNNFRHTITHDFFLRFYGEKGLRSRKGGKRKGRWKEEDFFID